MRSSAALLLLLVAAGCVAPDPAPPVEGAPIVVGAIGNSLMLGYNADADHLEAAPEVAWATGDAAWSFRARLGATQAENVAEPGLPSERFVEKVAELERTTLVLVLLLDPDVCAAGDVPGADEPGAFEGHLRQGVRALQAKGMVPLLVTPPDITSVAEAARTKPPVNDFALFYASGQSCAQEPGVRERQDAMYAAITRVAEEEGALHDHGAVASLRWTPEMVSDVDGLHPSPEGLEAIATAVWDAYEATSR